MVSFLAASFTWKADWLTCSSIFLWRHPTGIGRCVLPIWLLYFIDAFAPVPDGYRHHDTHIPHPLELFSKLLKTEGLVAI